MKVSNREKLMLFILGIILVGFGYYNFVYSVQSSKIDEKIKAESEIKEKYETAMNTINSLESKKSDAELLKTKIVSGSKPFYPIISEEHIILEVDKLLKDSALTGSIKFDPIVSDGVENADKKIKSLSESSLQQIVDKYNNKTNTTTATNNNNNNQNSKNAPNSNDSKDKKKDTVQYVKFQVTFEGSYDGISKFLDTIEQSERKRVVNSIKLSSDTSKGLKGNINLEIYSVPKIDGDLEKYLEWDLNNSYGKSVPFAEGSGNDSSNIIKTTNTTTTKEKAVSSDFIASVKSVNSDLPKIMLGKSNDDMRTSYVYGDSNSEEQVEMVLTQDGDKYYYKYKTSKESFPTNYDGMGEEFVAKSNDITLNILSNSRNGGNDNSAMKLKIINKTNKTVEVNISGDDSNNPRVVVDSNGSNVNVNKN